MVRKNATQSLSSGTLEQSFLDDDDILSTKPDDDPSLAPLPSALAEGKDEIRENVHGRTRRLRIALSSSAVFFMIGSILGMSQTWWDTFGGIMISGLIWFSAILVLAVFQPKIDRIGRGTQDKAARARFSSHGMLTLHASVCVYAAYTSLGTGSFYDNDTVGYWADPSMLIVAGVTPIFEVIVGVACVSTGVDLRVLLSCGCVAQLLLVVAESFWMIRFKDEQHSLGVIMGLMAYQSLCFFLGVYIGWELLSGHRAYYDEVHGLKLLLLQQRIETIASEKERLEYDRSMAIQASERRHEELLEQVAAAAARGGEGSVAHGGSDVRSVHTDESDDAGGGCVAAL